MKGGYMNLYISDSSLEEIRYFVLHKHGHIDGEVSSINEVKNVLSSPKIKFINGKAERVDQIYIGFIEEPISIDIDKASYNYVYLRAPITKSMSGLALNISSFYKEKIDKVRFIFEPPALIYFWDKYGSNPKKADSELIHLIDLFKEIKKPIDLSILTSIYESLASESYLQNFGTVKGSKILSSMSSGEVWTLINGDKPKLYTYLIYKAPIIWHFISANISGCKNDLIAVDLLVRSTFNIDKKDINNWNISKKHG
jgi:hypothetical protein